MQQVADEGRRSMKLNERRENCSALVALSHLFVNKFCIQGNLEEGEAEKKRERGLTTWKGKRVRYVCQRRVSGKRDGFHDLFTWHSGSISRIQVS